MDNSGNRPSRLESSEDVLVDIPLSENSFDPSLSREASSVAGVLNDKWRFCSVAMSDHFSLDFVAKTWNSFTLRGMFATGSRLIRDF